MCQIHIERTDVWANAQAHMRLTRDVLLYIAMPTKTDSFRACTSVYMAMTAEVAHSPNYTALASSMQIETGSIPITIYTHERAFAYILYLDQDADESGRR